MVENVKTPTSARIGRRGLNRRELLAAGVAGAAITGFPYVSRGFAAQNLKFWQFYGPGGDVAAKDKWFVDLASSWNDSHEVKVDFFNVRISDNIVGTQT